MSANIEYALISKVVESKNFAALEKAGITGAFFHVPEMKQIFDYLQYVYHLPQCAGVVPSADMIRQYYPSFNPFQGVPDDVPLLCKALKDSRTKIELLTLAQRLQMEAEKDPLAALAALRNTVHTLSTLEDSSADVDMSGAFQSFLAEKYHNVAQHGGVIGIPYPWDIINKETQGMQDGNFILIYGRPKSMKTWVSIYMAVHAYLASRRRVLFYTREMAPVQIAQRVAACICGVDYRGFKNAELDPNVYAYVEQVLLSLVHQEQAVAQQTGRQPYFKIVADRSRGGGGVGWLQAKIREADPDIVFVDGMYLMRDDRSNSRTVDWKNIAHISQDLKLSAQEFDIPIVGVTQANRKSDGMRAEQLDDIAYSDAGAQDADAAYRIKRHVFRDQNTGVKKTEIHIGCPGLREGLLDGFVINGGPAYDFSFLRAIVEEDEVEEKEYQQKPKTERPGGPTFTSRPGGHFYAANQDPKLPVLK